MKRTVVPLQDIQGLVFNEYINIKNARKILKNWDLIIEKLPEGRKLFLKDKSRDFDPILSIKKICKNNSEVNNVSYLPSKNLKNRGRLFAQSASLQNLPREFRGALATNYHDIDMYMAHPTILLQYCKKNGIICEALEFYVNNRDTIFQQFKDEYDMDKGDAKQLFLMQSNYS